MRNESGASSHEAYKARQHERVRMRLFRDKDDPLLPDYARTRTVAAGSADARPRACGSSWRRCQAWICSLALRLESRAGSMNTATTAAEHREHQVRRDEHDRLVAAA